MWTQYTREKPAKPGWTIATMAIALAATIGLAQLQVSANKPVEWKTSLGVMAESWPIAFQLPDALEWSLQPQHADAPTNEITYIGKEGDDLVCRVSFYCGADDDDLEKHLRDLPNKPPTDSFSVTIAKEKGMVLLYSNRTGSGHLILCQAERVDRTILSVLIECRKSRNFSLRLADWICESASVIK